MQFRKAKTSDAKEITNLWQEFMIGLSAKIINSDPIQKEHFLKKNNAKKLFYQYIKDKIKSKNSEVHLAEEKGKIIGYSLIHIKENIPIFKIEKLGNFADLYIKEGFRGQGISSQFHKLALKWFKQRRIRYASIIVNPKNENAHTIYKKWGFFDYHIEMRKKI